MNYVTAGFRQISTDALQTTPHGHEQIAINDIISDREGYLFAYLSNENQEAVNVHFDDFTVYHGKTNVVFASDYYPFGYGFSEYNRTASAPQKFKYNGKELEEETGWYHYGARMYQADIGKWTGIDPLAEEYDSWSPYHFVYNNPILLFDPDGREIVNGAKQGTKEYQATESALAILRKTNPEAYNTLHNSSTVYNITYAQLNPDGAYESGYSGKFKKGETGVTYSARKGLDATNIQKDGDGNVSGGDLSRYLTLDEQEAMRADGKDPMGVKKMVSLDEAGDFVSISGDVEIKLDGSLLKGGLKELTSILGHEFGHAAFSDQNTALGYLWSLIGGEDGHDANNPNGKNADAEEQKTRKGYKAAKKELKEEEK